MGENLLKHETESMEMAQKLTLMKNQIMEYDRHVGMNRKYGAVKITTLKHIPVTVSIHLFNINLQFEFVEDTEPTQKGKKFEWFLIIDSRQTEKTINCENIEEFIEKDDGRLSLIYFIPEEAKNEELKFKRQSETFECCENKLILKTYLGIQKRIIDSMGKEEYEKRINQLIGDQDKKKNKDKLKKLIK